jgi:hypothetical protein
MAATVESVSRTETITSLSAPCIHVSEALKYKRLSGHQLWR